MPLPTYPVLQDSERITDQNVHTYRAFVTFGAASITSWKGKNFTIERTGVGVYKVTLAQPYRRFIRYPSVTWAKAAGTAMLISTVNDESTLGTTGIFFITMVATNTAGTATEPATGNKCTIEWSLTMDPENDQSGGP